MRLTGSRTASILRQGLYYNHRAIHGMSDDQGSSGPVSRHNRAASTASPTSATRTSNSGRSPKANASRSVRRGAGNTSPRTSTVRSRASWRPYATTQASDATEEALAQDRAPDRERAASPADPHDTATPALTDVTQRPDTDDGPAARYLARVERGQLRHDAHQWGIVQRLQALHETLHAAHAGRDAMTTHARAANDTTTTVAGYIRRVRVGRHAFSHAN